METDREMVIRHIFDPDHPEMCAVCGKVLNWHIQNNKRPSVYHTRTDEVVCSYACLREGNHHGYGYVRYQFKRGFNPE